MLGGVESPVEPNSPTTTVLGSNLSVSLLVASLNIYNPAIQKRKPIFSSWPIKTYPCLLISDRTSTKDLMCVWFGLWHINHYELFNVKSFLSITHFVDILSKRAHFFHTDKSFHLFLSNSNNSIHY